MKIAEWYTNGFDAFQRYCSKKGYEDMDDLRAMNLLDLLTEKGFGPKYTGRVIHGFKQYLELKSESVRQEYADYLSDNPGCTAIVGLDPCCIGPISEEEYWGINPSLTINQSIFSKDIFSVFDKEANTAIVNYIKEAGIQTIGELYKKRLDDFASLPKVGKTKVRDAKEAVSRYIVFHSENNIPSVDKNGFSYEYFINSLGKYKKFSVITGGTIYSCNISDIIMDVIMDDPDFNILIERRDHTLDELGKASGVTRERIRQKEAKAAKRLLPLAEFLLLEIYSHFCTNKVDKVVWFADIDGFFNDDDKTNALITVLAYSGRMNEPETVCAVIDELQCIILGKKTSKEIVNELLSFGSKYFEEPKSLNEIQAINDELKAIGYGYIDSQLLIYNLLIEHGYKITGNYISKHVLPQFYYALESIIKLFPTGIHTHSDSDIELLKKELRDEKNIYVTTSNRAFSTAIEKHLYLCDRGTYCVSLPEMPYDLVGDLINYIDSYPKEVIPYDTIYSEFSNRLSSAGYTNGYLLHAYLKDLYGQEFCARDYFRKSKNAKLSIKDLCYEAISKVNGPISIKDIGKSVGAYNEAVLLQALSADNRILLYGSNMFVLKRDYCIPQEELDIIKNTIDDCQSMRGGYCKDEMLYQYLDPSLLSRLGIDTPSFLFSIVAAYLGGEYNFQRPIIYNKDEYKNTYGGYFDLLAATIEKDGIININRFKRALSQDCVNSDYIWIGRLKKDYIQIDEDSYLNPILFKESSYLNAGSVITDFMSSSDYALIKKPFDFSKYNTSNEKWTYYVLYAYIKQFGQKYGLSVFGPDSHSYKFGIIEKAIIYKHKTGDNINSYNDLAISIIKSDGRPEYSESALQALLARKGFLTGSIPFSIRSCDSIEYDDGIYRIK